MHFGRLRRIVSDHLPDPALARLRASRQGARAARTAYRSARLRRPTGTVSQQDKPAAESGSRARLFSLLSQGVPLDAAAAQVVRELVAEGDAATAVSFADALALRPETAAAGHLAAGIVAAHRSLHELAVREFAEVPQASWRQHAAREYLDAAYRTDVASAVAVIRQLVDERPEDLPTTGWFEAVRHAYAAGELELVRAAFEQLLLRAGPRPSKSDAEQIAWLKPWITREHQATAPAPPEGQVPFALIDYLQPGKSKTSQNIGDHVQTLASLGHLVRHRNVRLHGDDSKLVEFAQERQRQVRPDRRLDTAPADVALYAVDRDASNYEAFPEGTWALAFGWYMHPLFGLRHDFPLHPNLRPIFVSFHCNKREMLTGEAIEYLRRYGPVGCRDWTTVDLLLSLDVPAFFSGCLTTTVDTVFAPDAPQPSEKDTVWVDMPASKVPAGAATAKHSYRAVKDRSFVRNLRDAVKLLERYRTTYTDVVTTRLHCYLPVRSLGLNVDFRPKSRADVRFNGLIDIDDAAFDKIRTGMLDRLEPVFTAILAGKPEDEVYALWREVNAADVAEAEARHAAAAEPLPTPSFDVAGGVKRIQQATVETGPSVSGQVDVVIPVTAEDVQKRLPHTLRSLQAKASAPLRVSLLSWDCGSDQHKAVADAFGDVAVRWLPCDGVDRNTAVLLLPELLTGTSRAVLLPAAAVVLGDIAELADVDLAGHALAARTSLGTSASSGFGRLYRAAKRLHPDAVAAHELYGRIHARHVFDFDAFDTDVLVLDLDRLRADGLAGQTLPYLERFGFTAAEALTLYAGPNRAVLPPQWAHVPVNERLDDPRLVHWPTAAKPWQRRYVAGRELWAETDG